MRKLEWNEEYIITAEKLTDYGIKKIKTIKAHGFSTFLEAERESKKLQSEGYEIIKISIGKWTA